MVECIGASGWLSIVDTGQTYTYDGLTAKTQVHTYSFTTASAFSGNLTLDATDRAGNLTAEPFSITYDNVAPTPPTITVPSAAPATFTLSWSGQDSGAGVRNYDVQVRDAITSTWTPWLTGTTSTEAQFTGSPGHSYYFQIRATDHVNNTGAWQQAGPVAIRSVTKYYTFGSSRVAMRQGDEVYYLHGDHLGSTSLTTDGSGAVVAQSRYLPYGQERWSSGAAPTDFGFTGQRSEAGFGLVDYQARFYDPFLGRFVSADAVVPGSENPQAWNRYAYVYNNPLRYTDPSGHCPHCEAINPVVERLNPGDSAAPWVSSWASSPAAYSGPQDSRSTVERIQDVAQIWSLPFIVGAGPEAIIMEALYVWYAADPPEGIDAGVVFPVPGAGRKIPGVDKAFRAPNPNFPPNDTVVDAMNNLKICDTTDCADIADKLFDAATQEGKILRVKPNEYGNLNLLQEGNVVRSQYYHDVYTDGRYVYDPRLSPMPIPQGDWEQMIRGLNPGGVSIKPRGEFYGDPLK